MPSRNIPDRAGAAKVAPRYRAYRWSSGTPPRTKLSAGALCCEGLCPPSAIPGADSERTASVPARSIREHSGSRTVDTQNRRANGRQPDKLGTPLRWRTVTGIRAGSSEMLGEARPYATSCGLLKQPDKQKTPSHIDDGVVFLSRSLPPKGLIARTEIRVRLRLVAEVVALEERAVTVWVSGPRRRNAWQDTFGFAAGGLLTV